VVEDLATPQSEVPAVAPPAAIHPTLVPLGPYLSSLSATAPRRCHPRWEPDALEAPVRICGGGREQPRSLLRPGRRPSVDTLKCPVFVAHDLSGFAFLWRRPKEPVGRLRLAPKPPSPSPHSARSFHFKHAAALFGTVSCAKKDATT